MASKNFCDLCDREIPDGLVFYRIYVSEQNTGRSETRGGCSIRHEMICQYCKGRIATVCSQLTERRTTNELKKGNL